MKKDNHSRASNNPKTSVGPGNIKREQLGRACEHLTENEGIIPANDTTLAAEQLFVSILFRTNRSIHRLICKHQDRILLACSWYPHWSKPNVSEHLPDWQSPSELHLSPKSLKWLAPTILVLAHVTIWATFTSTALLPILFQEAIQILDALVVSKAVEPDS